MELCSVFFPDRYKSYHSLSSLFLGHLQNILICEGKELIDHNHRHRTSKLGMSDEESRRKASTILKFGSTYGWRDPKCSL
ncbi:hypothetical protein K7X08_035647 [Anisodus acutangulus]|uniref:Uncharacterized protein n=1 Tax=Anisodus acutangulus TaxID=402998 RepID=A0A9Q1LJI6_9SOLA|nr:hypothetical protein K7X08_035647 [Anisodus acutangulus]